MNVFDEALSAGVPVVNLNENEAILRHEMDLYKLSPVHLKSWNLSLEDENSHLLTWLSLSVW